MLTEYRLLDLKDDDPGLYKSLSKFGGTNATTTLLSHTPENEGLVLLYNQRASSVVGSLRNVTLQDIPDGEVLKHDDPRGSEGAWVVADGFVYNVTSKLYKLSRYLCTTG